jgi:hypothetical protein
MHWFIETLICLPTVKSTFHAVHTYLRNIYIIICITINKYCSYLRTLFNMHGRFLPSLSIAQHMTNHQVHHVLPNLSAFDTQNNTG